MKPMKLISVAVLCLLPLAFAASPFTDGSIRKLSPDQATLGQEIVGELDLPDLARMMDAPRYSWDDLPLSDGSRVHVVLDAFSPFTPNARLMEMTDHGVIDHPIPSDRKYFKGTVAGTERGLALFILYEGGFKGFVDIGGDRHIYGTRIDPDTGRTVAACCLFDTLLAPPPSDWAGHWAGHTDMVETPFGDIVSVPSYTSPGPRVADRQANLAVEMDWESYSFFGTYQACVNYAADLAAGVTLVYEADIQTIIAICNIRVWTTSDDPYSSGGGIDASDLLDELRNEYLDNMGWLTRANATLLPRRSIGGGVSYVNALCSDNFGYTVIQIEGNYSYPDPGYYWDTSGWAHELGHSFGSHHTHCYGPGDGLPDWVDKCYNTEGGCYNGTVENPPMDEKTLMSYCHLLPPYETSMTFVDRYAKTSAIIRAGSLAAPCLQTPSCEVGCGVAAVPTMGKPPLDVQFYGGLIATGCGGSPTFSWTFGDGGTSTQQDPLHSYTAEGTYTYDYGVTQDGQTCTQTGTVLVEACTVGCSASAPTSGEAQTPISFTSTVNPSVTCAFGTEYDWDFGDGSAHSTQANPSHSYANPGTYDWLLTVTVDGVQCTDCGSIAIQAPCSLTCSASANPTQGPAPLDVHFTADATPSNCTGQVTYYWQFGDGGTSADRTPIHTYSNPGTYDWTMTARIETIVTCQQTGTVTVTDEPVCVLTCTAQADPTTGNEPLDVQFTATATATDCNETPAFAWDFGDGATSTDQNPSHTYATAGTYNWALTVTADDATCNQNGSIVVDPNPCTVDCTASADPTTGQEDLLVNFTSTVTPSNCSGSPIYLWEFGDGATSTEANPSHTYTTAGTFGWTFTVEVDGVVCTRTGTITVTEACSVTCTAAAAPQTGTVPFTVNFTGTATPSNCAGPVNYAWDFGDGGSSAEQNPSHDYTAAGSHDWTLTVTVDDATCTQTGTITAEEPPCAITCTADVPAGAVTLQEITFASTHTATDCIETPTVHWDFGDGAGADTETATHVYETEGTYTWTLTVTADGVTCTQTGDIVVEHGIPGDANGDGQVTIGEVQQVINMFLGSMPAGNNADCDGDGQISIGEVQKAINAFLGVATGC